MSSAANGDTQTRGDEFGHQVVVHRHRRVGVLEHVCERRDALSLDPLRGCGWVVWRSADQDAVIRGGLCPIVLCHS
jgi:hypothetical protein